MTTKHGGKAAALALTVPLTPDLTTLSCKAGPITYPIGASVFSSFVKGRKQKCNLYPKVIVRVKEVIRVKYLTYRC